MSADGWRRARRGLSNYPVRKRPVLAARRAASRTLGGLGLKQPWLRPKPNPANARRLPEFRLFAILGTWMEADVVEASVKNAFAQGCDRLFLVDNDSPDETVKTAAAAGAELVREFSTDHHQEHVRIGLMREVVAEISAADGSEHIWWLWLDADEFSHGPCGLTIRDYLATLDASFRIVGARVLNHYPGAEPHYISGFHPLDFQPLGEELPERRCWLWHRKHPLQRFDRGRPEIRPDRGFHGAQSAEHPLFEPTEPIFLHHFPFRERGTTVRRLEALSTQGRIDPAWSPHMAMRVRACEAVYAHDWEHVDRELAPGLRRARREPVLWTELVEPQHHGVRRWYSAPRLEEAIALGARNAA